MRGKLRTSGDQRHSRSDVDRRRLHGLETIDSQRERFPGRPKKDDVMWRMYAATVVWLLFLIAGGAWLYVYETTSQPTERKIKAWPESSGLERKRNLESVVVFLHPRCPCTRATVVSLAELAKTGPAREIVCVFWIPEGAGAEWRGTGNVEEARRHSGFQVVFDPGGKERALFGARTSGEVFVFDPKGRLRLQGGITPRRGMADALYCRETMRRAQEGKGIVCTEAFGCPLETAAPAGDSAAFSRHPAGSAESTLAAKSL